MHRDQPTSTKVPRATTQGCGGRALLHVLHVHLACIARYARSVQWYHNLPIVIPMTHQCKTPCAMCPNPKIMYYQWSCMFHDTGVTDT